MANCQKKAKSRWLENFLSLELTLPTEQELMESPNIHQPIELDPTIRVKKKKKPKQQQAVGHLEEEDNMEVHEDLRHHQVDSEMPFEWGTISFSEVLRNQDPTDEPPTDYYIGEDSEEKFESVDKLFMSTSDNSSADSISHRQVEISKEKYTSLFNPWRGALILKLLGKTVSFKVLQQRTSDLWNLKWGYELIDMKGRFSLARFFSRTDYLQVLEGGPWIVMGHYLTVAKWRPNF